MSWSCRPLSYIGARTAGPQRAHSSVCSVVRYAFSAALEAEYSAWPGAGTTAAMDETATMCPPPREICQPSCLKMLEALRLCLPCFKTRAHILAEEKPMLNYASAETRRLDAHCDYSTLQPLMHSIGIAP